MDEINIPSITTSAMLAELSIGVYKFKKLDRRVSDEICEQKGAEGGSVEARKYLLSKSDPLEDLKKLEGEIRNFHYKNTIPWSDSGLRLVTMAQYISYAESMNGYIERFRHTLDKFKVVYPSLIDAQAMKKGSLFDRSEYPNVTELDSKFHISVNYFPLPNSGDFRVDVSNDMQQELKSQYESHFKTKMNSAMADLWDRLHTTLKHLNERLEVTDDGVKKVFRDSLLLNARELCQLLSNMNITNDPELEQRRKELESALSNVTVDDLRDSIFVRQDVSKSVKDILDKVKIDL